MFGDLSCVQPQISVSIWFGTAIHLLSFISSCTNIPWLPNRFFVVEDKFFCLLEAFWLRRSHALGAGLLLALVEALQPI